MNEKSKKINLKQEAFRPMHEQDDLTKIYSE